MLKASHKTNSSNSSGKSNNNSKMANHNNKVVENGTVLNGAREKVHIEENGNCEPPEKKRRLMETIQYDDLNIEKGPRDGTEMNLSKVWPLLFCMVQ